MKLAKQHLDIGLFTADITAQRAFWGEVVGLRLDHELTLRKGWVQHRFDAHNSVIKVNHFEGALPNWPASGYVGVTIARAEKTPWEGQHPGGGKVKLVPTGHDGVVGIAITVSTPEPARMLDFYLHAMEFEEAGPNTARCGDTLLVIEKGPGGQLYNDFIAPGYRYLTIQIFDADEACAGIVARGGRMVQAPISLGTVARYGFVADPDGNWFEISARASLTGVLPQPNT
jgi:lactoylglutathione lyase